jgi:autotransporter-associated beta strand protein
MRRCGSLCRAEYLTIFLLIVVMLDTAQGGSATWNINPPTNDWNTATNWTPPTIPNSPEDTATFENTNGTTSVIHSDVELDTLLFTEIASLMTITAGDPSGGAVASLTISGTGIVNNTDYHEFGYQVVEAAGTLATNDRRNVISLRNSATVTAAGTLGSASFLIAAGGAGPDFAGGQIQFLDNSSLGESGSSYVIAEPGVNGGGGGEIWFFDNSSAGNAEVVSVPGGDVGAKPGITYFMGTSTADHAYLGNGSTQAPDTEGGKTFFLESSTAGDSIIYAGGGAYGDHAGGGTVIFSDTASAGNSVLSAYGGLSGGLDGSFRFLSDSTGGTAQVELTRTGNLIISDHNPPGTTIGSLSDGIDLGGGIVILGSNNLTVGNNDLTTQFSGVIEGSGSLIKIGNGKLTLNGSSTYTGMTTVAAGILSVANKVGSATGSGPVSVMGGTLAGSGIVTETVDVGAGAFLAPSLKNGVRGHQHRLTIQGGVTFQADSTYSSRFHFATRPYPEVVVANGVSIANGAHFQAPADGSGTLPVGTSFVVIDNTSANLIDGTFENLPDGSIIIVQGNTLQANYEGGDGNDLVLTVVSQL